MSGTVMVRPGGEPTCASIEARHQGSPRRSIATERFPDPDDRVLAFVPGRGVPPSREVFIGHLHAMATDTMRLTLEEQSVHNPFRLHWQGDGSGVSGVETWRLQCNDSRGVESAWNSGRSMNAKASGRLGRPNVFGLA